MILLVSKSVVIGSNAPQAQQSNNDGLDAGGRTVDMSTPIRMTPKQEEEEEEQEAEEEEGPGPTAR